MQSTSPADGTQMKISTGCLWRDTLTRKPDEAHIRIIEEDDERFAQSFEKMILMAKSKEELRNTER